MEGEGAPWMGVHWGGSPAGSLEDWWKSDATCGAQVSLILPSAFEQLLCRFTVGRLVSCVFLGLNTRQMQCLCSQAFLDAPVFNYFLQKIGSKTGSAGAAFPCFY